MPRDVLREEFAAPSARVVVLNACFSDTVAEAVRGVVDCVVGMRGAIADRVKAVHARARVRRWLSR